MQGGGYYRPMPGQQGAPGMMDPMNSRMMSPGFNQASYSAPQAAPIMQGMPAQQGAYMTQQPIPQAQQFQASGRSVGGEGGGFLVTVVVVVVTL